MSDKQLHFTSIGRLLSNVPQLVNKKKLKLNIFRTASPSLREPIQYTHFSAFIYSMKCFFPPKVLTDAVRKYSFFYKNIEEVISQIYRHKYVYLFVYIFVNEHYIIAYFIRLCAVNELTYKTDLYFQVISQFI